MTGAVPDWLAGFGAGRPRWRQALGVVMHDSHGRVGSQCLCPGCLPAGRARAVVRTRVEPKTFFANERTFLQWLQIRWG